MNNIRVFVEKKELFRNDASKLMEDFNSSLDLNIKKLRMIDIYEFSGCSLKQVKNYLESVLVDSYCDDYYFNFDLTNTKYFATELLPSQFCIRSESVLQCIKLIDPHTSVKVTTATLLIFENITNQQLNTVKKYYINEVESREKNLSKGNFNIEHGLSNVEILDGFIDFSDIDLQGFLESRQLSMSIDDLILIQNYFNKEKRNPTITEVLLFDTYWSDHCRHTTFNTFLTSVSFNESYIENEYTKFLKMHNNLNKDKPVTLMNIATITAKYQRSVGNLNDVEVSEEVNSANFFTNINGEKYTIMFKNETHNHPTEIEPFGGAATCVGGAIRDILASRGYVYQAMRVSGSGDPFESVSNTLTNKLSQKKLSQVSAKGNSSYGNQIGVATSFVQEIVHRSYVAKHLEVGFVLGFAPTKDIVKKKPEEGDLIILLGGKTGKDGIGGATGSSKVHDNNSVYNSSAEVQKGNAIEERKLQRFFRNASAVRLIKRCNDLGAGGICVSVGEIANSVHINLNNVILKDTSMNGTEIALSESQERMSVVIAKENLDEFMKYLYLENIQASVVGSITNNNRLIMEWNGKIIVDISRQFLNTNGSDNFQDVFVDSKFNLSMFYKFNHLSVEDILQNENVACQKGLVEMFDSTIGSSSVLFAYGGKNLLTKPQVSAQKVPLLNKSTNVCTVSAYGFNPNLAEVSPFHSAMYAVVECVAKVVASGCNYKNMYFSFQEYFEKLGNDKNKWGSVLASLLGANYTLNNFGLASIGGKDSMSGTFNDLNVVPTLISFAVCIGDANHIISPEFKSTGSYIYLFKHQRLENGMANISQLREMYKKVYKLISNKTIISARAIEYGINESLCKMSFGNDIGVHINTDLELNEIDYGSIIVESNTLIDDAIYLGKTTNEFTINNKSFDLQKLKSLWLNKYDKIYRLSSNCVNSVYDKTCDLKPQTSKNSDVRVFIPVFPGTNCEYDIKKEFESAGASCEVYVLNTSNAEALKNSLTQMKKYIDNSKIMVLAGGFSQADEPDGSGKYIANILKSPEIRKSVEDLLLRDGLILGICNGFQALVRCGLLPFGKFSNSSVALYKNKINRHISTFVSTKVMSVKSPWLSEFSVGQVYKIPISHGEGQFVVDESLARQLFDNGQVAFCYCNENGEVANDYRNNPNGSSFAIEGVISPCGKILGKMGHSERYDENLYKNVSNVLKQDIFKNAISYFKEGKNE